MLNRDVRGFGTSLLYIHLLLEALQLKYAALTMGDTQRLKPGPEKRCLNESTLVWRTSGTGHGAEKKDLSNLHCGEQERMLFQISLC